MIATILQLWREYTASKQAEFPPQLQDQHDQGEAAP